MCDLKSDSKTLTSTPALRCDRILCQDSVTIFGFCVQLSSGHLYYNKSK